VDPRFFISGNYPLERGTLVKSIIRKFPKGGSSYSSVFGIAFQRVWKRKRGE